MSFIDTITFVAVELFSYVFSESQQPKTKPPPSIPQPPMPSRKLRLAITNQQSQKELIPNTYKISVNREIISGSFYQDKQPIIDFRIVNDHLNRQSILNLKQVYHPHGECTPQGIRYNLDVTQEVLPQIEQLIKYKVK